MIAIAPEMVLGKRVLDGAGGILGEIVDVGLYDHSRVKFFIVEDKAGSVPMRRFAVGSIDRVGPEWVSVRADAHA